MFVKGLCRERVLKIMKQFGGLSLKCHRTCVSRGWMWILIVLSILVQLNARVPAKVGAFIFWHLIMYKCL